MPAPIRFSSMDYVATSLSSGGAEPSAVGMANGGLALGFTTQNATGRGIGWLLMDWITPAAPFSVTSSSIAMQNVTHAQPVLLAWPDGQFLVVNAEGATGNPGSQVLDGSIHLPDGNTAHLLSALPAGAGQHDPVLAALGGGQFLVAYGLLNGDIRTARFGATGSLNDTDVIAPGALRVGGLPGQYQDLALASNDNGELVLAWVDSAGAVWATAPDPFGSAPATPRLILGATPGISDISLADDGRGGFLLTVGRAANAVAISLTASEDDGVAVTGSFVLAGEPATETYLNYDSTVLSDGRVLVTWTRATYDGALLDQEQVLGRLLSPTGAPDGAAFAVTGLGDVPLIYLPMTSDSAELADGRIAITSQVNDQPFRISIWDPREAGLNTFASHLDDAWAGTRFADVLRMGQGHDNARGGAGHDAILGARGRDALYGDAGNDTLYGGTADDQMEGGAGADSLSGGAGRDVVFYFDSATGVTIRLWSGTAAGGEAQGDTLSGIEDVISSAHADVLIGTTGSNILESRGGNDFLAGLAGADALYGGAGSDMADYSGSTAGVTVRLWNGTGAGGDAQGDRLFGIEHVTGSARGDSLIGDDLAGNWLTGGGGGDYLGGLGGADRLNGQSGNDTLEGGNGADQYVFGPGYGHDRVVQFLDGVDKVDLVGLTFAQFSETTFGTGVRLTGTGAAAGLILDLMGVTTAQVDAGDFI